MKVRLVCVSSKPRISVDVALNSVILTNTFVWSFHFQMKYQTAVMKKKQMVTTVFKYKNERMKNEEEGNKTENDLNYFCSKLIF